MVEQTFHTFMVIASIKLDSGRSFMCILIIDITYTTYPLLRDFIRTVSKYEYCKLPYLCV